MSTLFMAALVADRYGARLNVEQLAQALGMAKGTINNQISAGTFPIATYVDAGKRWADCRDVAAHLDACRDRAKAAA